ncbi:transmembrane protein [Arabidopsis thaliana]|uniref:Transmembrane protein n=1 Tax=Arabidopsis thaliana TaxID=3702 RepID=F4KB24_ARATH|nr:uncharacterized protein AT5G08440 [Arabidopsis thaliana]AED91302.2 transmembrane protein [Arabidopsis thaliana]|eukprot:NP_001318510.1 transmembrane protein [Arabidopsis thaliana]
MDNGHEERLAERFSGVGLGESSGSHENDVKNDSLFQVIKAVEAAEATIKQQVEENNLLKAELQRRYLELAKYKSGESLPQTSDLGNHSNTTTGGSSPLHQSAAGISLVDRRKGKINASAAHPSGMLVVHQHVHPNGEEATVSNRSEDHHSEGIMTNGIVRGTVGGGGTSQLSSSPSTISLSPMRPLLEGDHDLHINSSSHELMPVGEVNNSGTAWKQELIHKVQEQDQEILRLRKYLADYSTKEVQIRNEKYVLEKRIAHMRSAFDQQQQDLVDAASKALSYRQEIIEENIRLTYALQAAEQERSLFVSILLPLLSEYSLHPQISDSQSIVSSVKVLFRHLQEKLNVTETKLKETEYQLAPWQSDVNHSNASPLSPYQPVGVGLRYSTDSEHHHQDRRGGSAASNYHLDGPERSPAFQMPVQPALNQDESHGPNNRVQFREPLSNTFMDDAYADVQADSNTTLENSTYVAVDDPSPSNYPILAPVLEEPSSSFSEAADDDPLPGIADLQISGEPFPGRELQVSGHSINGTTKCNFEWVRHLEDGSVNYIDGAKRPDYLVTADDVDLYLAIEVHPLDDKNRKGELVRVFANENCKITCHPEMQSHIEKSLYNGHALFKVSYSIGYLDIWEAATLSIKKEGYSIKPTNDPVITEKFSSSTNIVIPFDQPADFVIIGTDGEEHLCRVVDNDATDLSCSRDTIVLTLRLFLKKTLQRKKGKKKGFLFNK